MRSLSENLCRAFPLVDTKAGRTSVWVIILSSLLTAAGCGGDDEQPNGSVAHGSGGTGIGGGGAGTGGAGTGTSGGVPSTGGTCAGGQPGAPEGVPFMCTGSLCPYGECSELRIGSDPNCSSVYPVPVNGTSGLCSATATGGYCLTSGWAPCTLTWAVTCASGAPTIELCATVCSASTGFPARCQ
jgi:hypothetical protein